MSRASLLAAILVAGCTKSDIVAFRPSSVDAGRDADVDAGTDAGADPVTGCPGPVNLPGASARCSASLAQERFVGAICSCLLGTTSAGSLAIDAFDSRVGPYDAANANLGGSLLANDTTVLAGTTTVSGPLTVVSPAGLYFSGSAAELTVSGPIAVWAPLVDPLTEAVVIGGMDVSIGGAVQLDTLDVTGVFHHPSSSMTMVTNPIYRGGVVDEEILPPYPCPCPMQLPLDLAGPIAAAATENENAAIGLAPGAYAGLSSNATLTLPCGRYHLDAISSSAPLVIHATGHVALFIDGDVDVAPLAIAIDVGASLDLFIGGTIAIREPAQLGDPARPSALRIYVAGSTAITIEPNAALAGHLFAGNARLDVPASYSLFGGVLARDLRLGGSVSVHEDLAIHQEAQRCGP